VKPAMLVHAILPASRVNGPGVRTVLFVQGCGLQCKNCWNPQTHPFTGDDIPVEKLVHLLLSHVSDQGLEGVTFSGGEPMQQAEELSVLMRELRLALPDISIGMFTGYSGAELDRGRFRTHGGSNRGGRIALWTSIREHLDFAVMGRYNRLQPSTVPLRSSRNQKLHLFSSRHTESDFGEQAVEITIAADGLTTITGFPTLGIPA
jgi:anaerobic ribonucleoside-triphosphate reductase activating protein